MCAFQISKRLATIASFLPIGTYFADIGSDHAQLACYVCLNDHRARAIAGDVNEGPYLSAIRTVKQYELQNVIDVRHGDGLSVLHGDHITDLVIAGMGGSLIKDILETGKDQLHTVKRIITQPNIGETNVRKWFLENNFTIQHEIIIEENNQIYEIIVADHTSNGPDYLAEMEIYFGPQLLKNKSAIFYKKWRMRGRKINHILQQLEQGSSLDEQKIIRFKTELSWIKEVLQDENSI